MNDKVVACCFLEGGGLNKESLYPLTAGWKKDTGTSQAGFILGENDASFIILELIGM